MPTLNRWNDDRLDGLSRHVDQIAPVVTEVAVLKTEMHNLTRELRANTKATEQVAEQMEKAQVEPLTRARAIRTQILIGVLIALVSGGLAVLGAVIASHP